MKINEIKEILNSPSVRLLSPRRNPMFIISFFIQTFSNETILSEEELLIKLSDFIENKNIETDDEYDIKFSDTFYEKAKKYIKKWTDDSFLSNYEGDKGEFYYELSVHTEKTLRWLNSLKKKEFVGTESKFKSIFSQLQELVEFTSDDKEQRIAELQKRKLEIERQIQDLEIGDNIVVFDTYQVKSRLDEITQSAKELVFDFKEVEENFKNITQEIHKKHTELDFSKGNILAYTFDAIEELKLSEQGKSFYAFWEFLLTKTKQNLWLELIKTLFNAIEKREIEFNDEFLKNLKQYLYKAGKKVYDANEKMAEKLSRIIGESENEEMQKTKQLLQEIKTNILVLTKLKKSPEISLEVETETKINLLLERYLLLEKSEKSEYNTLAKKANYNADNSESLKKIYNQKAIDKDVLRTRIKNALAENEQISLWDVIDKNGGISLGLAELFGYFSIINEFKTIISEENIVNLPFDKNNNKTISIPNIIISR